MINTMTEDGTKSKTQTPKKKATRSVRSNLKNALLGLRIDQWFAYISIKCVEIQESFDTPSQSLRKI